MITAVRRIRNTNDNNVFRDNLAERITLPIYWQRNPRYKRIIDAEKSLEKKFFKEPDLSSLTEEAQRFCQLRSKNDYKVFAAKGTSSRVYLIGYDKRDCSLSPGIVGLIDSLARERLLEDKKFYSEGYKGKAIDLPRRVTSGIRKTERRNIQKINRKLYALFSKCDISPEGNDSVELADQQNVYLGKMKKLILTYKERGDFLSQEEWRYLDYFTGKALSFLEQRESLYLSHIMESLSKGDDVVYLLQHYSVLPGLLIDELKERDVSFVSLAPDFSKCLE